LPIPATTDVRRRVAGGTGLLLLAALNAAAAAVLGGVLAAHFADLAVPARGLVSLVVLALLAQAAGCLGAIRRSAAAGTRARCRVRKVRRDNRQLLAALRTTNAEVARQRDLAQAANLAKSRFLAAASHDLRQPLHALTLYAESLLTRKLDPEIRELATHIRRGLTDSLNPLLERLLDISRLDAGAIEVTPAAVESAPIVAQMRQEFAAAAAAAGGSLVVNEDARLTLWVDPVLFCRILRNLLDNAVKHAGAQDVVLDVSSRHDRGLIRICDQGPGIPEREQGRVFEEFYQVGPPGRDRGRGLGLGLAIVQRLCRLQDIELSLESVPGLGTCFALRPPTLSVQHAHRYVFAPVPAFALLPGLRILIVDDEAPIRAASADLLTAWGCRCDTAAGFAEARTLIERRRFDVLLADYQLADGTTGMQVVGHARRMQPAIACFMISGDMKAESVKAKSAKAEQAGPEDVAAGLGEKAMEVAAGAAPAQPLLWLAKPVHPATLHQALQKIRRS
jgi:signal transduction histidine kinase